MISASLAVEGHPPRPHPHHHPLMTYAAEPCRPWPAKASPPAAPEFARPLPKRYNGAPPPPPPRGPRYQEAPVNLAPQHKDGSPPFPQYAPFHGLAGAYAPLYAAPPPHYAPPPQRYSPPPPHPGARGRGFKVPCGKEGSLKHRILTRGGAPGTSSSPAGCSAVLPANFSRGSLVQLASGELKRVEDLRTEDFVRSAEHSASVKLDPSTVLRIQQDPVQGTARLALTLSQGDPPRAQVEFETRLEHPFFVYGQGWASCDPERSLRQYGLACHRLQVGDVCISLTPRAAPATAASAAAAASQRRRRWSAPDHFLDGPPPAKRTKE
ncbi:ataxin-1-like [Bacillus rossius redtenbacheri]|uniref:ataxin-1-like n=1 Tax=Bacillus rossius redtenbacheri TaxID=93214 RepID=UPI002FDCFEE6